MPDALATERLPEREAMVAQLAKTGYLNDPRLEEAMLQVPRHLFVPEDVRPSAYEDRPLPVGHQQTISAPHMVAMMTTALQAEPGQNILEIGAGVGYHAAVVKKMVGNGEVTTLEYVEELADRAARNLAAVDIDVRVIHRDGRLGAPEFAPFDAIYVTCAIPEIPATLVEQLAEGGHFIAPVGVTECRLKVGRKVGEGLEMDDLGACLFVNAQGMLGDVDDGESGMIVPAP